MGKVTPKVALVHDFLLTYAGAERILKIFHELYPEAPIYCLLADPELLKKHFPKAKVITSPAQNSWLKKTPSLLVGSFPQAIESFDLSKYDLVLSSSSAYAHGVLTGPQTTHVCYCHSPIRYVWDWHHEYLRERGVIKGLKLFLARMLLSRIRVWDFVASKRVDYWIANSKTVAGRIKKFYRQDSTVIYPAVNTAFFDPRKAEIKKTAPYAISISRLSASKRVDLIIKACALAKMPLVIAGSGNEENSLKALAAKYPLDIQFKGAVSEDEKRNLIANASCFLFPSEDDFGIAPVEALALGTPVIAIHKGGATEFVQHGKNGYFFEEVTPESLAEQISILQSKGVSFDKAAIRKTALPFSEESFRKAITEYLAHV